MPSPAPSPEPFAVEEMRVTDLLQVGEIERKSFLNPWSLHAFVAEFLNPQSTRLVIRAEAPARVVAYAILWSGGGELHVNNLAVHPQWRRRKLGERLIVAAFARAREEQVAEVYLEVRPSNGGALELYRKLGFREVGRRRAYYSDNGEDALVLRCDLVPSATDGAGPAQEESST